MGKMKIKRKVKIIKNMARQGKCEPDFKETVDIELYNKNRPECVGSACVSAKSLSGWPRKSFDWIGFR